MIVNQVIASIPHLLGPFARSIFNQGSALKFLEFRDWLKLWLGLLHCLAWLQKWLIRKLRTLKPLVGQDGIF